MQMVDQIPLCGLEACPPRIVTWEAKQECQGKGDEGRIPNSKTDRPVSTCECVAVHSFTFLCERVMVWKGVQQAVDIGLSGRVNENVMNLILVI